jgi:uncharacterized C2H2 Zn-finger protein
MTLSYPQGLMRVMYSDDRNMEVTGLHVCPVCSKMFLEAKSMYLHVMRVHPDGQRLAYNLRADLYKRWQERLPRISQ